MARESLAKAGMMDDLGKHRINDLPLDDRSNRGPTYQPPPMVYHQTEEQKAMAAGWNKAVQSGKFNDSDADEVRGLDCLDGWRRYDKTSAQRLAMLPPHARSGMAQSAAHTSRAKSTLGVLTRPAAVSHSENTQVANVPRTPQLSAPAHTQKVDVPPTPGPSPVAPPSRSSTGAPEQTRAVVPPACPPSKPTRGLGSSRWAMEESAPWKSGQDPIVESQKGEVADNKSVTSARVEEAAQILSTLKIADTNVDVAIEVNSHKRIDPLTGKELGTATMQAAKAWLTVDRPRGRKLCALYVTARNEKCVDFEVRFYGGEPGKSHGILEMLSHTSGGAFLDMTFRTAANEIVQYSFEFATEKELLNFVGGIEVSRELLMEDLSKELDNLEKASTAAILRKQNSNRGSGPLMTGLTTVTYSIPAPTRNAAGYDAEVNATGITRGRSSSDTKSETPAPKRQRVSYTREQLKDMQIGAISPPRDDAGVDFPQAVRRPSHRKTDSQECVLGVVDEPASLGGDPSAVEGRTGRYTAVSDDEGGVPSVVLGQVRQTVARNKAWLFQNGTGL